MKVIIPMAGRGTRLRPHTLTLPKPLLKIAGKTIIEWIVEEIKNSTRSPIDSIHYVIGDFGKETENLLINIAEKIGCHGFIHYQHEPLGTAHAIYCASEALEGEVFIAFADTIFKGRIEIDPNVDGIIWTMLVNDPEKYGVVRTDINGMITEFVEKPRNFVSKNAIVGLYFFKQAENLRSEIKKMIDNDFKENNEYQLTNCLEELKNKGDMLKCAELDEWLDCGNMGELIATNRRLNMLNGVDYLVGENCNLVSTEISGFSTIGDSVECTNSTIENCIIYDNSCLENCNITDSIIGKNCVVKNFSGKINLGDFSVIDYV